MSSRQVPTVESFASIEEEDISRLLADKGSKSTNIQIKFSVLLINKHLD